MLDLWAERSGEGNCFQMSPAGELIVSSLATHGQRPKNKVSQDTFSARVQRHL